MQLKLSRHFCESLLIVAKTLLLIDLEPFLLYIVGDFNAQSFLLKAFFEIVNPQAYLTNLIKTIRRDKFIYVSMVQELIWILHEFLLWLYISYIVYISYIFV